MIGAPGPNSDTMFVNGGVVASIIFSAAATIADFGPVSSGPHLITSDAQKFEITFTAPGQQFERAIEFIASITVPELASLGLLAAALIGFVLVCSRHNSNSKTAIG